MVLRSPRRRTYQQVAIIAECLCLLSEVLRRAAAVLLGQSGEPRQDRALERDAMV